MSQSQRWRMGGGGSQQNKGHNRQRPTKQCANPIFESWIMEWKEEAEAKDSKMKYVYGRALQSLRKYPLSLSSGKECSILENFGAHMCKMLDTRMAKENLHLSMSQSSSCPTITELIDLTDDEPGSSKSAGAGKKTARKVAKAKPGKGIGMDDQDATTEDDEAGASKPSSTGRKRKPANKVTKPGKANVMDDPDAVTIDDEQPHSYNALSAGPSKPKKSKRQYLPVYRSGGYAILMALFKKENDGDYRGYMTKGELQQEAQKYCDASMTKPDSTKASHFTAWNSMKALTNKELVLKRGNPAQYFLTPEGRELAQKLDTAESSENQIPKSSEDLDTATTSDEDTEADDARTAEVNFSGAVMQPGKFEVVLYVDTCETNGRSKQQDVINELQKNGVTVYVHRLNIGDFVWVCREVVDVNRHRNRLTLSGNTELILPYVVERKRTDDLAHSIRDGRFHEQKFRLMQSKLKPIYLIESYGKGDWGLAEGALGQAICNTQIGNDFLIHETSSIKETCGYLTFMTRHLKNKYENKTLIERSRETWSFSTQNKSHNEVYLLSFSAFNDFSVKKTTWKVKEMFARHLMRLRGLSVDKAYAIVQKYPTLHDLIRAYAECETEKQKDLLLQPILFGNGGRKVGPSISKKINRLYNSDTLP